MDEGDVTGTVRLLSADLTVKEMLSKIACTVAVIGLES